VDAAGGTSHGYLNQDGRAPGEIASDARVANTAISAISAKQLIIATGVRDELPPVPCLAERWGCSVFHCPYCHG
jgi:thioredoxin reductase